MPINSFLYPGAKFTPAYEVANSCRFNDGDSAYMHNTLSSSDGSDVKGTISFWTKRGVLGANMAVICGKKGNTERVTIGFSSDDYFEIQFQDNSNAYNWRSSAVYRDVAAWYNFVIHLDTGNGTANSRARVWVNNSEITSWGTRETVPQNLKIGFFNGTDGNKRLVGARGGSSVDKYYDGYIAEVVVLNNTLDAATNFGEFDEDSSNLGNDANGGTDFTEVNLAATDQSSDTCTNNFAVLNPLLGPRYSTQTYSEGNTAVSGGAGFEFHPSTIGVTTGKWYFEAKCTTLTNYPGVGIIVSHQFETNNEDAQSNSQGYVMHFNGQFNSGGSVVYTGTALSVNDIVMIAFDAGNGNLWFGLNGTWQNSATQSEIEAGTTTNAIWANVTNAGTDSYHFLVQNYGSAWGANFGNPPFSISSGNADGNGYGNFEYAVPSGYYALCTKNLAEYG